MGFEQAAMAVGAVVIIGAVGATALFAALVVWVWFPARFQFTRDPPSHLDTPSGPLRLTLLTGVGSRRKARWFFGFMLLKDGEVPRARVTTKKAAPPVNAPAPQFDKARR